MSNIKKKTHKKSFNLLFSLQRNFKNDKNSPSLSIELIVNQMDLFVPYIMYPMPLRFFFLIEFNMRDH